MSFLELEEYKTIKNNIIKDIRNLLRVKKENEAIKNE